MCGAGRSTLLLPKHSKRLVLSSSRPGTYIEFSGAAEARAGALRQILLNSIIAAVLIFVLLFFAFGNLSFVLV